MSDQHLLLLTSPTTPPAVAPPPPPPPPPGGVTLYHDGAWLRYPDDTYHVSVGVWQPLDFLYRSDRQTLVDTAVGRVSAVHMCAVVGTASNNPFVDNDAALGTVADTVASWTVWIEQLSNAGIVTYLVLYAQGLTPFGTGDSVTSLEADFIATLQNELGHIPLLVWVLAEQWQAAHSQARMVDIASTLRGVGSTHPIAVHGTQYPFAASSNIDMYLMDVGNCSQTALETAVNDAVAVANGQYVVNAVQRPAV